MESKELVLKIQKDINKATKDTGQEIIYLSALNKYLNSMVDVAETSEKTNKLQWESLKENLRREHERNLAHYDAQQKHTIELFRSVILYGATALKSSMLINGGAAAGLLAFIGKIWKEEITQEAVNSLTVSIVLFSFGVLVAAIGTAFSYITQYLYTYKVKWEKISIGFHVSTILLVIASYILFGIATYKAYLTFVIHLSPNH